MKIGSQIRQLRTERQLSQEALAQRLGLSRQAVAKWEAGAALPSTVHLLALCEVFGVSLEALTGGEAPAAKPHWYENRRLRWALLGASLLLAGLAAVCGALSPQLPEGIIGFADGPTQILVTGPSLLIYLPGGLAGLLGLGALALFVCAALKRMHRP